MRRLGIVITALAIAGGIMLPASAQTQTCAVDDTSTQEVLPGVTLTWDSSFRCTNAPDQGTYEIEVTVANAAGSSEAVKIEDLRLKHTTPKPRGQAPDATAEASGLPMTVAPGDGGTFTVSGDYELVSTDEGDKANLHLKALGSGASSGDRFKLGIKRSPQRMRVMIGRTGPCDSRRIRSPNHLAPTVVE